MQAHDLEESLASVGIDSAQQEERHHEALFEDPADRNLKNRSCMNVTSGMSQSFAEREALRMKAGLELHRAVLAFCDPRDNDSAEQSLDVVRLLLQQRSDKIDVNAHDKYWRTPLHVAVTSRCSEGENENNNENENSHRRLVELLLARQEVDVNATALYGLTPLHLTARLACSTTGVMQLLLADPRVRLDAVTDDGFTAFHLAAEGDGDDDRDLQDSTHAAITLQGYLQQLRLPKRGTIAQRCEVVQLLLEEQQRRGMQGCQNERDILGRIPLYYAAIYGCSELIKALLQQNNTEQAPVSDVLNTVDVYGFAPLHLLAHSGQSDALALLLQMRPDIDLNVKTAKSCNWHEIIRPNFTSESGAPKCLFPVEDVGSPQQQMSHRMTALHIAAELGDNLMVQLLLSATTTSGIQINEKDSAGWTPLHFAVDRGHIKVLALLLCTTGIEINEKDGIGSTPLHLAAERGHIQILGLLLNATGIKVNETDTSGSTPLHLAACKGHEVIVHMFLEQSEVDFVAVNGKDDEGLTPLFHAVKNGHTQVVRLLLEKVRAAAQLRSATSEETFELFADLLQLATDLDIHMSVAFFLLKQLENVYKENGEWDGSTLAHAAAKQAHERLIYHILMWRPDEVNALDALHSTPLHRAVQNGRIAVVKALCLEGSWCLRAATLDKFGMMPLDYALGLNSDDHVKLGIQKLLLERPEVEEYLQRFSNGFFTAVVTILLVVTLIVTHTYGVRLQQPLLANSFCNNSAADHTFISKYPSALAPTDATTTSTVEDFSTDLPPIISFYNGLAFKFASVAMITDLILVVSICLHMSSHSDILTAWAHLYRNAILSWLVVSTAIPLHCLTLTFFSAEAGTEAATFDGFLFLMVPFSLDCVLTILFWYADFRGLFRSARHRVHHIARIHFMDRILPAIAIHH